MARGKELLSALNVRNARPGDKVTKLGMEPAYT